MAEPISQPVLFVRVDHPEDYPPVIRPLMSAAPFWSVVTGKGSTRDAAPSKRP